MRSLLASTLPVLLSVLMFACAVSVSLTPGSASLAVNATQQFSATLSGTTNTAVTWEVNSIIGGNSTIGTISTSGLYTAPASVPSPATVSVTAVSQADPTKSGTAGVTITAVASNVTVSVTVAGVGTVTSSPAGINCGSTCTATFASGSTVVLTESGGTFVGWGGACSGSGSTCTISNLAVSTSVTASFGGGGGGGGFTILNLPVHAVDILPNGVMSKKLPHAGAGGPTQLMPNSDAIIAHIFSEGSNGLSTILPGGGFGGLISGHEDAPGPNDFGNTAIYFGNSTDPIYHITGIKNCGTYFAPLATKDSNGYITNIFIHAPNAAQFSNPGGGDQDITIWDQSGSGLLNGWTLDLYQWGGGTPYTLPACGSGQTCTFNRGNGYCGLVKPQSSVSGAGGCGGLSSNHQCGLEGSAYFSELESGHILHAAHGGTGCEGTAGGAEPYVVFPNITASGALKCTSTTELAPPNAALFFLDYTDTQLDCMNPSSGTHCTGNDGQPVAKLATVFQYARIEQLSHYGIYEADTSGPNTSDASKGESTGHEQSSQSYLYYASHGFPGAFNTTFQGFATWLNGQCSGSVNDATNPCYRNGSGSITDTATRWIERIYYGVPKNLNSRTCTAANACGVLKHLHIADPCVAVGMAGLTSFSSPYGKLWNACF